MYTIRWNAGIRCLLVACLLLQSSAMLWAQEGKKKTQADPAEIAELKKAVEADLKNAEAHAAYIKAVGAEDTSLNTQYQQWSSQHPDLFEIPLAYAEALYRAELPAAKPWLEKLVQLNPGYAKGYQMLWIDAERWGDFAAGREFLRKAVEADPSSPDHAFYYASSFNNVDSARHHQLMLAMDQKFPGTERAAQALYWLANRSKSPKIKEEVYQLTKSRYNLVRSNWASGAMSEYYDFLLKDKPAKALALSQHMLTLDTAQNFRKPWEQRRDISKALTEADKLIAAKKYAAAFDLLNPVKPMRYSSSSEVLLNAKMKALAGKGEYSKAYDTVLVAYSISPTDELIGLLKQYARKLGKPESSIEQEVWAKRKAAGKPATVFNLDNYLTPGKTSLADLKGKVVLVTYWFPGCGPCRGEFPHFENVVQQFSKDQLAYIGINMAHEQDPYVAPFMRQSGYSFVPVRDEPDNRGNLEARGAPTNYLIDKNGNIIFANFRTHAHNERTLELMIRELLAAGV
ncbi:MAG: TlpA disulfide reductase family protein [Candidatus Pseudobacter hemicellulosilyticus]|uniref:TlpA disulfide reductase family protein n=1 Tax=Candidatus Pseudobacter hemicellulosilyticus TaxID=3121375 RepID=A0AAJ5WVV3_9BACT|nr:MAG: TlpA disulfide reductase family protein [Pseudobacter sp.]